VNGIALYLSLHGDVMSLVDSAGQPVRLAPGNTWIELVPNGMGSVTIG